MLGTQSSPVPQLGRSILAGCTLSTSWARAYLRPIVDAIPRQTNHLITEHVDDIDQLTVGPYRATVETAVEQATGLGLALLENKMEVRLCGA